MKLSDIKADLVYLQVNSQVWNQFYDSFTKQVSDPFRSQVRLYININKPIWVQIESQIKSQFTRLNWNLYETK